MPHTHVKRTSSAHAASDVRQWLHTLSVHRWMIIAVTSLVVAVTAVINFTATPYYRAKLRLLIERNNAKVVSFQELYSLGGTTDDYYLTQYKILESRLVAESAMARLPASDRTWFEHERPDAVRAFMSLYHIRPVTKSRLVDIITEHPDLAVAKRMADAIAKAYVQHGLDRRTNASSSAVKRLTEDAAALQKNLIKAQQAAQDFKTRNQIVSMDDRQSLTAARLEKLADELASIESKRREADARLKSVDVSVADASLDSSVPEVLENPVIGNFKRALLEARSKRSRLARTYRPKHPQMQALTGTIESLEAQLATEVRSVHTALERDRERTLAREAEVRARLEAQKSLLLEMEGKTIQYNILRDEAENTRRLHDTVLSRLKELEIIEGAETTNVSRIGGVEGSNHPALPRKTLNILFALMAGLLLGCGGAFMRDVLDRTVKTSADAARILEAPVLGLVPQLPGKRHSRGPLPPETLDIASPLSEAFRTIRTGLAFAEVSRDVRSLVVTSAAAGEGKSMISVNLAASFARAGKRVLLVDADMRRPRLHKAFSVTTTNGLSTLLIGGAAAQDLIHATVIDGLFLLPCGVLPPSPVELLTAGLTREAMDRFLADFDMVIFDSPPVGLVSDARVLSHRTDQVLFVVSCGSTDRGRARQALGQLRNVGAKIGGLIVNNVGGRSNRYEYAYEYGYEGYASDTRDEAET